MKRTFLLLILLTLLLAACAPAATPEATSPPTSDSGSSDSSEPSSSRTVGPVTVTDALGRELTFETPPSRIAIAGSGTFMIADAAYLFPQAAESIAAIQMRAQNANFVSILDPNYPAKNTLDMEAGPEQIAAVQPDLVILKSTAAEKLGAPIEDLDIPIFYVNLETPQQYLSEIKALGQIFGDEARAAEVANFYQERMDKVKAGVENLSDDQKPSVLVMQSSVKGGETAYEVPPREWIQTLLVEMAGGQPIWLDAQLGGGWTVVTLEQIAAWNPDQIYIIDYFDDPSKSAEAFSNDPIAQNLTAVQNGQVFGVPKDAFSWGQPDTRWILALTWLAKHIQPEQFADLDILQEFNSFYQTLYGLDQATIDSQIKPLLQGTLP